MFHTVWRNITTPVLCSRHHKLISVPLSCPSKSFSTVSLVKPVNTPALAVNSRPCELVSIKKLHSLSNYPRLHRLRRHNRLHQKQLTPLTVRCHFLSSEPSLYLQGTTPIEIWGHETDPFGVLNVRVPFHVTVQPLNPLDYPEMNRVFVKLLVPIPKEQNDKFDTSLSRWSEIYKLNTTMDGDNISVVGHIPKDIFGDSLPPMTCLIEVPIKYDVNVEVEGNANVSVMDMEGGKVNIKCHHGNCLLKSVKAGNIDVYSVNGNIESSGVLQGNLHLKCQNIGVIKANRLQGPTVECSIGGGSIDVDDIYADTCNIVASASTQLSIGSCHGDAMILMKGGDIKIRNLESNLDATTNEGNINLGLTNTPKNVILQNHKGDINLGLSPSFNTMVDLSAKEIKLNNDFGELSRNFETMLNTENNIQVPMELKGYIGGGESSDSSRIKATANQGQLTLRKEDWFSSLGLKLGVD